MLMAKKRQKNKNIKRIEFSQKLVILSWAITIIWISLSFLLAFFDKDTNSEVTVSLITESFGITIGYFIYQASLKISRNKHKIDCDGIPYAVKQKMENIYGTNDESNEVIEEELYEVDNIGGV